MTGALHLLAGALLLPASLLSATSPSAPVVAGEVVAAASAPQVKAELVRRLTHYVTWPPAPAPESTFVVCVMEDAEMEDALEAMVTRAGALQGEPCTVRRLGAGEPVDGCRIAWVGKKAAAHAKTLKQRAKATRTLLVSDDGGLCGSGVHVMLEQRNKGFGVHVDRPGTTADGFGVSSKLLRVARPCP